jgi:dual specificity protein kinase YAK1
MLEMGKQSGEFFEKTQDEYGRKSYRLKSMDQYSREHGSKEQPSKKYFSATTLPDIIKNYPMPRKNMKPHEIERGGWRSSKHCVQNWHLLEMANRAAFIDFAQGLLNLNPLERWTPAQAKLHPFITQAKFTGPFVPPMTLKSGSSRSPAPGVQEQQRYEGMSRQRQQAQQQVVAAQQAQAAQHAAYANMQMNQYAAQPPHTQPNMYNNVYSPNQGGAPPPYPAQAAAAYGQQMGMMQPQQPRQYTQPQNLYTQATTRAGRQWINNKGPRVFHQLCKESSATSILTHRSDYNHHPHTTHRLLMARPRVQAAPGEEDRAPATRRETKILCVTWKIDPLKRASWHRTIGNEAISFSLIVPF